MNNPLLSISGLTVSFPYSRGRHRAVDDVSLDLSGGRSLGIVGESGSGKSLTALSVLNLLPVAARVDQGSVFYYPGSGKTLDLLKVPPRQIRQIRGNAISMIFQEPMTSLNPVFTCGDQVVEAIRTHQDYSYGQAKKQALKWFREVELPSPERIYKSYPHELSGGQRQRVMIAMAVSCNPSLLIADEPTTALDVTIQQSILQLLGGLKERYGMSLMFISHDLAVVSQVADDLAVMHQGRVVEKGTKEALLRDPQNDYTRGLMACRPPLDHRPQRLYTLADFTRDQRHAAPGPKNASTAGQKSAPTYGQKSTPPTGQISSFDSDPHDKPSSYSNELFSLRGLSKDFALKTNFWGKAVQQLRALDRVDLDIYKGQTLGLVGESGSGKSTLARVLLRLSLPSEGLFRYQGGDVAEFGKKQMQAFRQQVQIVFQDPYSTLNPRLSTGSMISEPLRYYRYYTDRKQRRDRVMELLENVRLTPDYYNRYPHELSGGERQRVAIARVLALNPGFLVLDEAVSALDVSIQAEILNLLQELKSRYHLTYVFITHDFSVVRFMSDRIAVMKEGRVVETGAAEELFRSPSHGYTRRLLESIPSL
mgnify:CR=1 FL=1